MLDAISQVSEHGRRIVVSALMLVLGLTSRAETSVTVGDWSQEPNSLVRIPYVLSGDEERIITFDVLTNGVSIGTDNLSHAIGDVYKIVTPGTAARTILWRPDLDWSGHVLSKGEVSVRVIAWPKDDPPDYMVVNLSLTNAPNDATKAPLRYYPSAGAVAGGVSNDLYRGERLLLRRIHAAGQSFTMGTPENESFHVSTLDQYVYDQWLQKSSSDKSRDANVSVRALPETQHEVGFTKDFFMGVFPITYLQMNLIENTYANFTTGTAYQHWKAAAYALSWNDLRGADTWPGHAPAETSTLGKLRARTGLSFDMPTEAQWEYACRAGTTTSLNIGRELSPSKYDQTASGTNAYTRSVAWAWCYTSAEKKAKSMTGTSDAALPVGLLTPNAWGLYDMHGLVCEWCLDWVDDQPLADAVDPIGCASSTLGTYGAKAQRGGSSEYWPLQLRSGCRMGLYPAGTAYSGLRVVCPVTEER